MYSAFNEQLGRPLTRRLDLSSIRTALWTAWERASGALKSLACLVPLYFESPSLKRGEIEAAACSNAGQLLRKCTATNSETEAQNTRHLRWDLLDTYSLQERSGSLLIRVESAAGLAFRSASVLCCTS